MLYNSFPFLFVFLPVTLILFYALACTPRRALFSLVIASILFYAYWDVFGQRGPSGTSTGRQFNSLWVLLFSIAFNYAVGARLKSHPSRALLGAAVAANLVALGYFKYANFLIDTLNALFPTHLSAFSVILPLGISFFTFTQIAFLVDCHKGKARELDFPRYVLFVTFFPHLIAGPIVHHSDLMPQFTQRQTFRWDPANVSAGLAFLTLGLFKKVAIADVIGPWATAVFDSGQIPTFREAWAGALSYTFQLYFDFSGYSDMAIGLGLLFNVRLPDNFNAPYRARSIIDFWSRWHITLSRFLRDYLYIPLGGNRKGSVRRYLNLLLTMLLGGLWHGAGFPFLLWGLYHGLLLCAAHLCRALSASRRRTAFVPDESLSPFLSRPLTFLAVFFGWILFRAGSIPRATPSRALGRVVEILRAMSSPLHDPLPAAYPLIPTGPWPLIFLALLLLAVNTFPTSRSWLESRPLTRRHAIALAFLFVFSLLLIRDALLTHAPNLFIYFQF